MNQLSATRLAMVERSNGKRVGTNRANRRRGIGEAASRIRTAPAHDKDGGESSSGDVNKGCHAAFARRPADGRKSANASL